MKMVHRFFSLDIMQYCRLIMNVKNELKTSQIWVAGARLKDNCTVQNLQHSKNDLKITDSLTRWCKTRRVVCRTGLFLGNV